MGKHKIVKSAAAVALTASVVATAVAPGASAASYKTNSKDQLVYTKSGKLVKGWKVFGGKLYKNGKLAPAKKYKIIGTGAAQQLFYGPTLKKGYKTANSKTLLFKDGKLADGWKQAGKGERLYKNGKLDKGYTVFTNVEGDKFLYQNGYLKKGQKTATRGGETNLFVDGKLAKGYVLHEASKTLYNNGKVAEGLVQYPEKDGKFYNNGKLANGEINGAEYKDGVLAAKDIASVKAINGTTVEVTFKEAQKADDVKAADYKIEGLEVKNAAVKQTDSKVVVLTTSAQEAAKEYTLVYKEADTKTFTGISGVVPTDIAQVDIKKYQTSQQATVGTNVTVKAVVTVAEGQSKAGIPVTFNVDAYNDKATGSTTNFNEDKTVEVYTDENGVATYSYTQYHAGEDTIYAYPTGEPTKRADLTKVYWGVTQPLTVTDETAGATLANDAKKVYKVKVDSKYINAAKLGLKVTFADNYEVTPDKVNYAAKITDGKSANYVTPYQTNIKGQQDLKLTVDDQGYATFTVTGANTTATPVVFIDGNVIDGTVVVNSANSRLDKSELQATASTIQFDNIKTVGLTNVAQGVQQASRSTLTVAELNAATKYEENFGGRQYVATLKDKDGKTAPEGTVVYVNIKDAGNNNPTTVKVFDLNDKDLAAAPKAAGQAGQTYALKTDKNGQIKYVVSAAKQSNDNNQANGGTNYGYATPVAYLDNNNNKPNGAFDSQDTHAIGEVAYFGDAVVAKAVLQFTDAQGKEVTKLKAGEKVTVKYQTVDQNGFPYAPKEYATTTATFQLDTTFGNLNEIAILNAAGKIVDVITGNTNNGVKVQLDAKGQATIQFESTNESTVNVEVSSSQAIIDNVKGTFDFEGKTTGLVTTETVAAVNASQKVEEIKAALTNVAAYQSLKDKDAFLEAVLANLKAGNTYTVASLTKAIDDAKAAETKTDAELAKEVSDAIKALPATADLKATDAAAVKAAAAKFAALTADQKKLVSEADQATLKAAQDKIAELEGEEKVVTVKDLGSAAVIDDADKATQGFSSLTIKLPELTGDLKDKTKFTVELADGTKIVLAANKFDKTKLYGEVPEKYTKAEIEAAKVTAE